PDFAERASPVAVLVTVTSAPTTAAPVASVTVPWRLELAVACPKSGAATIRLSASMHTNIFAFIDSPKPGVFKRLRRNRRDFETSQCSSDSREPVCAFATTYVVSSGRELRKTG